MDFTRVPVDVRGHAPGGRTNAYVLGDADALIIDPASRTADLTAALDGRSVANVAVTHHHPDHASAVAHYARVYGATVWARAGREDAFERATGVRPDRTFGEATSIPVGDEAVRVIETPGHAPEHVAFEMPGGVLVGDLAVAEGSVAVGAPDGDVRAYLTSLRRMVVRDPAVLYPGHGPAIHDSASVCERLIRHRLDRERRIADAVSSGARTVEAIVDAAYEKDLTGVRDLANATVVAHLEKLAVEGRVEWDDERARP